MTCGTRSQPTRLRKLPPSLRPYQLRVLGEAEKHLAENPIIVLPTGGGKTFTASVLVKRMDARTLWLAHRTELIAQARDQLLGLGLNVGVIKAGMDAPPMELGGPPVYVASVQTLARREVPEVDLVVVDECHHTVASQYLEVLEQTACPRVGLTATPFRLDGQSLGDLFGHIAVGCYPDQLVDAGVLVQPTVYVGNPPDMTGVKKTAGDYAKGQSAEAMGKLTGDIIEHWKRHGRGRRTVCYAVTTEHSRMIVAEFQGEGVKAVHLDGNTPADERADILARLRRSEIDIVCNCMVLVEGWDLPELECIIDAAPTQSLCLHLQKMGRVMRSATGKRDCVVLDHAGNHHRHGLATRRVSYTLEGKCRPGDELGLKRCPRCFLLVDYGASVCPECGLEFGVAEKGGGAELVVRAPGELKEYKEDIPAKQKRWRELVELARANGCDIVWAMNAFKEQYGQYPASDGALNLCDPAKANLAQKRETMCLLARAAAHRGYEFGWTSHKFKEIFGCWPKGFVEEAKLEYYLHGRAGQGAGHDTVQHEGLQTWRVRGYG